ncbi:MAG: hypothetical protein D4R94_04510 [Chitinophagaceae bacterium]|nr:MAG: hypothetical protein D4R94_04510 [Chitinophagaceae bacterium]
MNQQKIVSPTLSNNIIIDIYKESLSKDADFIKMIHLETQIKEVLLDGLNNDNGLQLLNIEKSLTASNTKEEMILAFSLNGINNGEELVNLFQNKVDLLKNIINKFPNLHQLNKAELKELYITSRASVLLKNNSGVNAVTSSCTNDCCRAYVNNVSDCWNTFALNSSVTVIFAAFQLYTTENLIEASRSILIGIGSTKLDGVRCENAAVRDYRLCMHYEQ